MTPFDKFVNMNYYTVYDELQEIAHEHELFTSLIENGQDYNIDENPDRVKVHVDEKATIVRFEFG
jgi:ABC-type uncharacterized transport system substrate-binding protein